MVFLQKFSRSTIVDEKADSLIEFGNQIIHQKVIKGGLATQTSEGESPETVMACAGIDETFISEKLTQMNVFMPPTLFDNNKYKWILKIKVDENACSGKSKKNMKDVVKKFRLALDASEKYRNTVAVIMEKTQIAKDGQKWELVLQDSFRLDLQTA